MEEKRKKLGEMLFQGKMKWSVKMKKTGKERKRRTLTKRMGMKRKKRRRKKKRKRRKRMGRSGGGQTRARTEKSFLIPTGLLCLRKRDVSSQRDD